MKKTILLGIALSAILFSCETKTEEVVDETPVVEAVEEVAEVVTGVQYTVNTEESAIHWKGAKVLDPTYGHYGTIKLSSGEVTLGEGNVILGGSIIADMNTIEALDLAEDVEKKGMLEGHLKGAAEENKDHFFNVSEHPTASFEITSVEGSVVKGNFTIKGITNEEEFEATVMEEDGKLIAKTSEFKIDRVKYKVEYGSATSFVDLAKDKVISDDIMLEISLVLTK